MTADQLQHYTTKTAQGQAVCKIQITTLPAWLQSRRLPFEKSLFFWQWELLVSAAVERKQTILNPFTFCFVWSAITVIKLLDFQIQSVEISSVGFSFCELHFWQASVLLLTKTLVYRLVCVILMKVVLVMVIVSYHCDACCTTTTTTPPPPPPPPTDCYCQKQFTELCQD